MKVYGEEIGSHVIDHALSQMELHRGFTARDLEGALVRAGVSKGKEAVRCADRTLQKLRKMGAISFDGKVWKVVTPPKADPASAAESISPKQE